MMLLRLGLRLIVAYSAFILVEAKPRNNHDHCETKTVTHTRTIFHTVTEQGSTETVGGYWSCGSFDLPTTTPFHTLPPTTEVISTAIETKPLSSEVSPITINSGPSSFPASASTIFSSVFSSGIKVSASASVLSTTTIEPSVSSTISSSVLVSTTIQPSSYSPVSSAVSSSTTVEPSAASSTLSIVSTSSMIESLASSLVFPSISSSSAVSIPAIPSSILSSSTSNAATTYISTLTTMSPSSPTSIVLSSVFSSRSVSSLGFSSLATSLSTISSSTSVVPSTTSLSCSASMDYFKIQVVESGKPSKYFLAEQNVPGLEEGEDYWGYQELPFTEHKSRAAVFSTNEYQNLISTAVLNGAPTTVYAAVRLQALGNSLVQLYPANHLASDMWNYTLAINADRSLSLTVRGAAIQMECTGNPATLAVLTPRFALQRGAQCTPVQLWAVPYCPHAKTSSVPTTSPTSQLSASSTKSVSQSISKSNSQSAAQSLVPSNTQSVEIQSVSTQSVIVPSAIPSCAIPDHFTILVEEENMSTQYLYDPYSVDDDALSFTYNASESLIFSLTPTGQLEFNVVDLQGNPVLLISDQDVHNAGNEAIFFSTAKRYDMLGYLPVVATIDNNCDLDLRLPYNGAQYVMACEGTIFLLLSIPDASQNCVAVTLQIQAYTQPLSTPTPTPTP